MKILNYNLDQYQALLFDLDGTILNSMPMHNKAWLETLTENGVDIGDDLLEETMGMASLRIVELINKKFNVQLCPKTVARSKRDKYLKVLDEIQVVPEVFDIIKKYHGKVPLGIITGGSHEVVDQLLPKLELDKYFDSIICSDDTEEGKDSKAPYILAGEQLGVDPTKCIFLDDGDVGLKGAKLTGMDVIHVNIDDPRVFIR